MRPFQAIFRYSFQPYIFNTFRVLFAVLSLFPSAPAHRWPSLQAFPSSSFVSSPPFPQLKTYPQQQHSTISGLSYPSQLRPSIPQIRVGTSPHLLSLSPMAAQHHPQQASCAMQHSTAFPTQLMATSSARQTTGTASALLGLNRQGHLWLMSISM
jgi:hypothetical protein